MKRTIKVEKEVDIRTLEVSAGVRYWEDAEVNGVDDTYGDMIPCRVGDRWCPVIDFDSGIITNWTQGVSASVHYKVCDDGQYTLKDEQGNVVTVRDNYVPDIMCPKEQGYGDYIIMDVWPNGQIAQWSHDVDDFFEEED